MHAEWRLYGDLRDIAAESVAVEVGGSPPTVADALDALLETHPDLTDRLRPGGSDDSSSLTDAAALSSDIAILRNGTDLRAGASGADGLAQPLDPEDDLVLLPAISGG
jgi:molybdopterin synthase sulfur carrier subunit